MLGQGVYADDDRVSLVVPCRILPAAHAHAVLGFVRVGHPVVVIVIVPEEVRAAVAIHVVVHVVQEFVAVYVVIEGNRVISVALPVSIGVGKQRRSPVHESPPSNRNPRKVPLPFLPSNSPSSSESGSVGPL